MGEIHLKFNPNLEIPRLKFIFDSVTVRTQDSAQSLTKHAD